MGEDFAGSAKPGSVPQNSVEPLGFCRRVLQKVPHSKNFVEEPSYRTPKVLLGSGKPNPAFQTLQVVFSHCCKLFGGEFKGCLIKGCLNLTKIPKVGILKAGIPTVGIPKTEKFRRQGFRR